jgi:DNA-binding NarL/FixJ family response regulator
MNHEQPTPAAIAWTDEIMRDRLLACAATLRIVGAAASTDQLLDACGADAPDVIVLCLTGHVTADWRESLTSMIGGFPDAKLIAIVPAASTHREVRLCLSAGAVAVVMESELEKLIDLTVAAVVAGHSIIPASLTTTFRKPVFTAREKQVLGLVVIGMSNSEIARRLFLAESTVKSHLSSSFGKLGVASRKEATAMILDPESGFGTGILGISGAENGSDNGYEPPVRPSVAPFQAASFDASA